MWGFIGIKVKRCQCAVRRGKLPINYAGAVILGLQAVIEEKTGINATVKNSGSYLFFK